jgi:DNA-binding CsgD family transcriptional regulator/tetratricopeptide (TPR) repeat protein
MPPRSRGRAARLIGRAAECRELDSFLEALRRGESRSLVIRGEAGVGKTALLEYLAERAADGRVIGVTAVQSEVELAFAALHQLCTPILDELEGLPAPQREALRITFGLHDGPVPDRFLVGLAVLSLLAEAAAGRPLVCVVDDAQWLDRASAQVLMFVARRLGMESVGLVFAARVPAQEMAGLPQLVIEGLKGPDARALLDMVLTGPVDTQVREEIVAETGGNPLALVELPRGLTPGELAGGFGLPGALALPGRIEETFQRRISALPADTRRLLLLAAAEPLGEPLLVWRAADHLGIDRAAVNSAVDAGLVVFGARVRFRHPLVRSAVYHSASAHERQEAHRALAEVTDPVRDPDRRAWHRAQATPGLDEDVAAELERSAGRAQARGGFAAAAAFLERAAVLTPDLAKRSTRALAAAQAKVQAGALDAGLDLLAMAEAGPLGEFERARADLVRAQIAYVTRRGRDAPLLVLNAARRLEPIAPDLARATYVDAIIAAGSAGRFAAPGGSILDVARQVSPVSGHEPTVFDLLLDGMVAQYVQGYTASVPILRSALNAFFRDMPAGQELRGLPLALMVSSILWDDEACTVVSERWARFCRDAGALSDLLVALSFRTYILLFTGDLSSAASLVEEVRVATDATGIDFEPVGAMAVAAFRGNEAEASPFIEANMSQARHRREGNLLAVATWASAVLNNGLGRYQDALAAAQQATDPLDVIYPYWALAELIEAAVRSGTRAAATDAYRWLAEMATATASDWALGLQARSRALLADDDDAEHFYREAIEHLGRTRMRAELARAHLLYGEWLRRQRRPGDAREQLRTALGMLEAMGMEGFSERARRELRATGETRTRKRSVTRQSELTVQEAQVAKLAREGLSNPEIGARLYISARTAEYHLSKVFIKLNITSRAQLEHVLT